jgi:hypothetical protein
MTNTDFDSLETQMTEMLAATKAALRAHYQREAAIARELPDDCTTTIDGDPGL